VSSALCGIDSTQFSDHYLLLDLQSQQKVLVNTKVSQFVDLLFGLSETTEQKEKEKEKEKKKGQLKQILRRTI